MRIARLSAVLFACLIAFPSAAHASVAHVVQPGETLWSIAAANNLTTRTVAAVNGISPDAHVVIGSTVQVPPVRGGAAALGGPPAGPATPTAGTSSAPATSTAPSTGGAVGPSGVSS